MSRRFEDDTPSFHVVGICHLCRHRTGTYTCAAFPGAIPTPILVGDVDHGSPVEGDHGIQFAPTP